ncbi:MAG: HlyD family efflux transporter periplasmic adaptor subunit, partial [Rhodopirellula sp.]|nr:HlyD family efflux transporter periplasmic adaptor subunit [Rhodopirellula sp.]
MSSSARKLPIRKRPDLISRRSNYLGHSYWIVKDPVGLNYYRFQDEEYAILQMLDGRISLDEIKERFEEEFPPQKITLEELQQFLGTLHRSGLVVAGVAGQGHQLRKRRDERKRKQALAAVSNVLCIRFKGFDPERLLNRMYPYFRWLFSPWTVAFCCLLALSALTLVTVEFDVFRSRLPAFQQFFSVKNGFLLLIVLGITKIFHEFGHGLSCKHFGGECHEMGVMILVLTPCLYCNVSDSWLLPSKWRRAAIGAAGILVELLLASIATFFWWFSQPGLFNNLCLNIMFISSVSTILFNANPLLRYDGYYILADLMEIPNLRQKATTILSRKLGKLCLGLEPPDDPFLPQRNQILFAVYSVAAALYRWVVVFSICWFLYKLFQSYEVKIFGQILVAAALWGLLVTPLYKLGKFFYVPGRIDQVKKPRFYTSLSVAVVLLLLFLFLPLPHSVMCPLEIQARDAHPVYVDVAGTLKLVEVESGQRVAAGQTLAQLANIDLDIEVIKLQGTVKEYEARVQNLMQQSFSDRNVAAQLPSAQEALKTVQEQLRQKMADQQRLRLTAPDDGTVLPPTLTPSRDRSEENLAAWSGTPLERENLGAFLEQGVLFCQIGDPKKLEAVIIVDQSDRNLVLPEQRVDILVEGFPDAPIKGAIEEISESELKVSPPRLSTKHGGELPTQTDPTTGIERPQSTSYQARVPIDDPEGMYLLGLRG